MRTLLAQNREVPIGGVDSPTDAYDPLRVSDVGSATAQLELFLSNVLALITILAGLGFLLFFIFGTVQWILAGGDDGRVANARKQMTQAGVGLVITMVAYSIMTIVSRVLGIPFLDMTDALGRLNPL